MKNFFANLFRKDQVRNPGMGTGKSPLSATFKRGDLIIFGNYEIGGLLGRGGFGEVYLAYDRRDKSVCALKTIRADYLADAISRNAFRSETL
jgi:serine/threonine protein kinase